MRYILIPDVHGRNFWRSAVEARRDDDIVVFLGDYVDPYPHENISNKVALQGLKDIIELKKSDPDHIVLLLGNHDMGYLAGAYFCSSRHWQSNHDYLHEIFSESLYLFDLFYMAENIMISHAGVYRGWLKYCNLGWDVFENFNQDLHNPEKYDMIINNLNCIDMFRGGWSKVGSPVWADIHCAMKDDAMDIEQIVGHTQLIKDPIRIKKVTCIDCRRAFLLEDGELKEMDGSLVNILEPLK